MDTNTPTTPPATPATTPPQPTTESPAEVAAKQMSQEALKARLAEEAARAERALLKQLGLDDIKTAKAKLEQLSKLEQEKLSETERAAQRIAELEAKGKAAEALQKVIEERAALEFERLPKEAQDFIAATAGDDPVARLNAINAATKSGLLARLAAPATQAPTPAAPAAPALPAAGALGNTMAPSGPTAPAPASTKNELQHYETLKAAGRTIEAAQFYKANRVAIEQQKSVLSK